MSKQPDWSVEASIVVHPTKPTRYTLQKTTTKHGTVYDIRDLKSQKQVATLINVEDGLADTIVLALNRQLPPRKAVTAVLIPEHIRRKDKPYGIGLAFEDTPGYQPWKGLRADYFATYDEAQAEADHINTEVLKLDPKEAFLIVASTMAGGVRRDPVSDEDED